MSKVSHFWSKPLSILYVLIAVTIPFLYNNCTTQPGANYTDPPSFDDLSCKDFEGKITLSNKLVKNVRIESVLKDEGSKLYLPDSQNGDTELQKISTSHIPEELSIVIDYNCAKNSDGFANSFITEDHKDWLGSLLATTVAVDDEKHLKQLEDEINNDDCILTANPEMQIEMNSFFSDSVSTARQPFLNTIQANEAYAIFFDPENGIQSQTSFTNPTTVAVLDSGIFHNHSDLKNHVGKFSYNGSEYKGFNLYSDTDGTVKGKYEAKCGTGQCINSKDVTGHGTHVAGIIAARAENGGVHGVSPYETLLLNYRVINEIDDAGTKIYVTNSSILINAISIAANSGAEIINISLGEVKSSGSEVPGLKQALVDAVNRGTFVALSLGNIIYDSDGSILIQNDALVNGSYTVIPGKYGAEIDGVITVAATTGSPGQIAPFSLYHPDLGEISAPGDQIVSTSLNFLGDNQYESDFKSLSGTSQSTPQVAGAAALMINWLKKHGLSTTPGKIETLLKASSMKHEGLESYVKDGNELNLYFLAKAIEVAYPSVAGGSCD